MRNFLTTLALIGLAASPSLAAPCKDTKGKFIKCPETSATSSSAVTKDANGKCHIASGAKKGQFIKCK